MYNFITPVCKSVVYSKHLRVNHSNYKLKWYDKTAIYILAATHWLTIYWFTTNWSIKWLKTYSSSHRSDNEAQWFS